MAEGKAEVNSFDGYPDAYKVCAKHVLPVLLSGKIPDSEGPCVLSDDNYFDEQPSMQMTLNKVVMEALNEDDLLVIEAWDQS